MAEVRNFWGGWFIPWRSYVAEFLGTFIFVLVANGAVLTDLLYTEIGPVGKAMAAGLAISAAIFATVHLSGAHLNPAVTLGMWITGRLMGFVTIFYIVAQLVAGLAAAAILLLVFGPGARELGLGIGPLGIGVTSQQALLIEAVLTAILILTVFATFVDRRGLTSFGPLAVGLVVAAAGILAGPLTGAILNPARVIGPAVISQTWENLPIWIVGPALGSFAGILYEWLFLRKGKR